MSLPTIKLQGYNLALESDGLAKNTFIIKPHPVSFSLQNLLDGGQVIHLQKPSTITKNVKTDDNATELEPRTYIPIGFAGWEWDPIQQGDDPYAHLNVEPSLSKVSVVRVRTKVNDTAQMTRSMKLFVIYCWDKFTQYDEE